MVGACTFGSCAARMCCHDTARCLPTCGGVGAPNLKGGCCNSLATLPAVSRDGAGRRDSKQVREGKEACAGYLPGRIEVEEVDWRGSEHHCSPATAVPLLPRLVLRLIGARVQSAALEVAGEVVGAEGRGQKTRGRTSEKTSAAHSLSHGEDQRGMAGASPRCCALSYWTSSKQEGWPVWEGLSERSARQGRACQQVAPC